MHKKREPASTADDLLSRKRLCLKAKNAGQCRRFLLSGKRKLLPDSLFLKIVLDKANAGLADFLVVEVDQVICASAKSTAALCLLDNDFFTFGVDLQVVVALDLQLPTQFFRQDKTSEAVYTTHNARVFHFTQSSFLPVCFYQK